MPPASTITARSKKDAAKVAPLVIARPLFLALTLTALLTALRLSGTVDSDVAWQLWIAGRIHAGAQLYRDIIEVNPPLWFWMALPVDALAGLFDLRPETVLVFAVGGLVMLALIALDRLTTFTNGRRTFVLTYAAFAILV